MPDQVTLALFALAAVALVAVPGPNLIYIVTRSMSEGRRAGIASALGVETGTVLHVVAAAIGLSALLASSALAFSIVKYAGAAYLVYLGVRALVRGDALDLTASGASAPLAQVYKQGVLVQLLNPKVALFFLAFLPQFVDPANPVAVQVLVLGALLAAIGLCIDVLYALAAGAAGAWLRARPGLLRRQRHLTAGVYIGLGAAAALSGSERPTG